MLTCIDSGGPAGTGSGRQRLASFASPTPGRVGGWRSRASWRNAALAEQMGTARGRRVAALIVVRQTVKRLVIAQRT